jgi:DnaJ-class molecular chaperone
MAKDYYAILGVTKNASQDEIKRAYRKAAHKHHPDKGGDAEKFKEINEAYQILSDTKKRTNYDQFGSADAGAGAQGQGFGGFEDIFGGQAGGFNFSFGDLFGDVFESAFANTQASIEIPLTTALLGGTIQLTTQNNDRIDLKIPEGTPDGTTFSIRGKGAQTRRGRGDLHLTVRVRYPRRLTKQQKNLLNDLRSTGM